MAGLIGDLECRADIATDDPCGAIRSFAQGRQWAIDRLESFNVMIELSIRCNLRCVHCYNIDRDNPRRNAPEGELTTADILALLPSLRAEGCLFLGLTGGEIFVHPGLFEIIEHAGRLGMAVRLLSNGTLLQRDTVDRLTTYPNVISVSLSLYGASAPVHDAVTRLPGSFDKTWAAARMLRETGLLVMLKHVVMKANAHEVGLMVQRARTAGLASIFTTVVFRRYDGTDGSLAQRLDAEDLERLYRGPLRSVVPREKPSADPSSFMCNCARGNCAISARGDVYPCISVPLSAGNVRRRPFREIWRNSPLFRRIRGLQLADFPACSGCPDRPWCKHPRGTSYLASGSYTGVDPWICEDARIVHRLSEEGSEIPSVESGGPPPWRALGSCDKIKFTIWVGKPTPTRRGGLGRPLRSIGKVISSHCLKGATTAEQHPRNGGSRGLSAGGGQAARVPSRALPARRSGSGGKGAATAGQQAGKEGSRGLSAVRRTGDPRSVARPERVRLPQNDRRAMGAASGFETASRRTPGTLVRRAPIGYIPMRLPREE